MTAAVLAVGECVHVITRRLFDQDPRRHFVGRVEAVSEGTARVRGHAFIFNSAHNEYEKRSGERVRVISLLDAGNVVNVLPEGARLDELHYALEDRKLVLTDGAGYSLDINEFGPIT
jgi:hypothetical protein